MSPTGRSASHQRQRGRPPHGAGAVLTRDQIICTALEIAGTKGFTAVTMHHLASELGVTPRALYNHVRDRQDVIDGVAALIIQQIPIPDLDASTWQPSLRAAYLQARQVYRGYPRAMLLFLQETVSPPAVDARRIKLAEHMLQFFVEVGLSLTEAITVRSAFLIDVLGFVLAVDYLYDTCDPEVRPTLSHPVPAPWLAAHPEVKAPLSTAATRRSSPTSDEMFDAFVDLRIRGIASLVAASEGTWAQRVAPDSATGEY